MGKRCPEAQALPVIANHDPNFGDVVIDGCELAQGHNLGAVTHVRLREQRQSPMVIHTRDESQDGVGQVGHRRREPEVSRSGAQLAIEVEDRAVLGPAQRTNVKIVAGGQRQVVLKLAGVLNNPAVPGRRSDCVTQRRPPLACIGWIRSS